MRQRVKLRDQIEHRLRAIADVLCHRPGGIEHEVLRQIAHDQVASPRDFAAVRRLQPGEDAEEGRLAAAVASDQPNAVAFVNTERCGVKHRAFAIAHADFSGSDDRGHVCSSRNRKRHHSHRSTEGSRESGRNKPGKWPEKNVPGVLQRTANLSGPNWLAVTHSFSSTAFPGHVFVSLDFWCGGDSFRLRLWNPSNRIRLMRTSYLLAASVSLSFLTTVGPAAEPLRGAADVLKRAADQSGKTDSATKPPSDSAKFRADLTNFTTRAASLAPAAAARECGRSGRMRAAPDAGPVTKFRPAAGAP